MQCSTVKKYAILLLALGLLGLSVTGGVMMFKAFQTDDFNIDQYMKSLGLIMLAVTIWIPAQPTFKKAISGVKGAAETTIKSLSDTAKMLQYKGGVNNSV